MSLDSFTVTRPNQRNGGTDPLELCIEQYFGEVMGTLDRVAKLKPFVDFKPVRGTSTIRVDGIGESTLQKITPGQTPNASTTEFGKHTLTVDTPLLARTALPMLDEFQSNYDKRAEIGREHGKLVGKFVDETLSIVAIKASLMTNSAFYNAGNELNGHSGASQITAANALDVQDPAKLDALFNQLFSQMEENKDVDLQNDGAVIVVRPATYYKLLQSERLISTEYITSTGNKVMGKVLASHGIPVVSTRSYKGGQTVTGHLLSNAGNGNYYDGDFSKVVATVMTRDSIFAGETIAFTPKVFWDELSKSWYVDIHGAFAATHKRVEQSGSILIP